MDQPNRYPEDGPRKPKYEEPCNGCGVCCVATPCKISLEMIPSSEPGLPCPALEWEGGRSWCGLVRNPTAHSPEIAELAERVKPELREEFAAFVGAQFRYSIGDGGCDSGFHSGDATYGMTARNYHDQRPELNSTERGIVGAFMRLMVLR